MKITRIKLVNFIGIKVGTGLDEIEINFDKSDDLFIQLVGDNGSGKSTIMSQLHPYKEAFDNYRKTLIVDGLDGRKEIDFKVDGHLYEITHTYTKSAQSFIKKDGKELNENGGVRTFEDIVSKELGVTKEYFQIGKIGSNTKNFVDLAATERKNYIGSFLNIEEIINKFKIANAKNRSLKKDIATIGTELAKYKDKKVIETEIEQISKSTEEIDKELSELYKQEGSLTALIKRDEDDLKEGDLNDLQNKINSNTLIINSNKDVKSELEANIPNIIAEDIDAMLTQYQTKINQIRSDISVNTSEKQNKLLLITDTKNKISATKIELAALGNPEDIVKLTNDIDSLNKSIEILKAKISNNKQGKLVNDMLKNKKDISMFSTKFVDFTNFIEKYYKELGTCSITTSKSNISYFFDDSFKDSLSRQIAQSRNVIDAKQKLLEDMQKDRGIKESYVCQLKNLEKRPIDCKDDQCPFIKEALLHKNVLNEISCKDIEISQAKSDLAALNIKADNLQELQNLYKNFLVAYENVLPRDNLIYTSFLSENNKSLIEWVTYSLDKFQLARQLIVDEVNNAYQDINEYLSDINKRNANIASKKILEDSDSTVREKYEKDIQNETDNLNKLNNELDMLSKNGEALAINLKSTEDILEKYQMYSQSISKINSSSTMLSTANTEFKKLSAINSRLSENRLKFATVENSINSLISTKASKNGDLISLKSSLSQVIALNNKLTNLNKTYDITDSVTTALSPSSGIPLILIKTYLEETEAITNDLLQIALGDDFKIQFVTTDREFSIQVISKNNIKPDILIASQGEIAITTISISLALIEQSIGQYNILCLDEIDGTLDKENRRKFIDILERQIQKLGIEQVFLISHNDAFDSSEMGLILLKNGSVNKDNTAYMKNKHIIFEL